MKMKIKTNLILEIGSNHQGSMDMAKKMIRDAVKIGAWGVKFQKRDIDSMPKHFKYMPRDLKNSFANNYYDHRKILEFDMTQIMELKTYAEKNGLKFIVTVFDYVSAKNIIDAGISYIKIPSQLYSNYEITRFLISEREKKNFKFFASTGMHTIDEIIFWQYFDCFDVLFYCKSVYPFYVEQSEFNKMIVIKNKLKENIIMGYSSHEKNGSEIKYAVLLGAKYIERHYTLDKTLKGSDHGTVSSNYDDIIKIIEEIKFSENILKTKKELCNEEKIMKNIYRGYY